MRRPIHDADSVIHRLDLERAPILLVVMDLKRHLKDADPEMFAFLREEKQRQVTGLELIASEVRR